MSKERNPSMDRFLEFAAIGLVLLMLIAFFLKVLFV